MTSTRQLIATAAALALAGCTERSVVTGKQPENIPREHDEAKPAPKPAPKPDRQAAYERRKLELDAPKTKVDAPPEMTRIGVAGTKMFHRPDCPLVKDVPTSEQVRFTSPFDGVDAGYTPCASCRAMK
jgi:hypothetical protein